MENIHKPVNIAIVGCGYWGPNLIRNFYQTNDVKVSYVCDSNKEKLKNIKKLYPDIKLSESYSEVLQNEDIDALCIVTPLSTHYKIAKEALLAGKHVLVEKPFVQTSKEAKELIELAKEKKRVLMVDHTFIYTGAVQKIKDLSLKGELGEIIYFDSERINLGLIRKDANVLWDLAVHDISIIDYLISQKPLSVSALGSSPILRGGEEMAHLAIKHEGGIVSHVHVSWLSPLKIRKVLVGGTKKMVLYDDVEPTEKIKIYDRGVDIDMNAVTPFSPLYRSGDILIPKIDQTEALKNLCEHFIG